jgi:hypothetical protein
MNGVGKMKIDKPKDSAKHADVKTPKTLGELRVEDLPTKSAKPSAKTSDLPKMGLGIRG